MTEKNPDHIAIIMDGNGRWATNKNKSREYGHLAGTRALLYLFQKINSIQIKYLTVFAFSTENWKRPKKEVNMLLKIVPKIKLRVYNHCKKNKINLKIIGDMTTLPSFVNEAFDKWKTLQHKNPKTTLIVAFNYGGKSDIVHSVKTIIDNKIPSDEITEALISQNLYTRDLPPVDILIRTAGEKRISNFLIWQCAYAEFFFLEKCWPDFEITDLQNVMKSFRKRKRNFGSIDS